MGRGRGVGPAAASLGSDHIHVTSVLPQLEAAAEALLLNPAIVWRLNNFLFSFLLLQWLRQGKRLN